MRVQHNILAMNSYRNYSNNVSSLGKNLEKLSSGYKINRAGDDAAGLAISEKMRAQITGLNAAQKNVKDGISFVKTAEGAMQEIEDMLNRMKYLATQSANGTYDNEVDRANLQKEVVSLKAEIDRIADSANFNGKYMLRGGGDATSNPPSSSGYLEASGVKFGGATVQGVDVPESQGGSAKKAVYTYNLGTALDNDTDSKISVAGQEILVGAGKTIDSTSAGTAADQAAIIRNELGKVSAITSKYDVGGTGADIVLTAKTEGVDANADTMKAAPTVTSADAAGTGAVGANVALAGDASNKAKYTYQITTPLAATDGKVTIAGKTFEIGTGAGKLDLTGKTTAADQAGAIKDLLAADAGLTAKYDISVSTDTITMEAKAIGVDADATTMSATPTVKKAATGAATATETVPGAAAGETVPAHKTYDLSGTAQAGDTITIDGKTYTFKTDSDGSDGATFKDLATLVTAAGKNGVALDTTDSTAVTISKAAQTDDGDAEDGMYFTMNLQIGDDAADYNQLKVQIGSMNTKAFMGQGFTMTTSPTDGTTTYDVDANSTAEKISDIDISDPDKASKAIESIKNAINYVSSVRGDLGALQNRLDHTANNLSVMAENIQDAESTIRDTDVAEEMMSYVKNNILVQSAQAMLAQANQVPQGVLQLLG